MVTERTKPIDFWDHPTKGLGTPAKEWIRLPAMQHALEEWLESVARSLNGADYP